MSKHSNRHLLNGDEAVAYAARAAGVLLGTGYPGTPSTEILEAFAALGGNGSWSPNEKVALEVALGASLGGARAMCTMKHVGLNVAADPLFTATHTGVSGALVVVVCDDPGMASSQNEQDSRRYAIAAGAPMLEPGDSQEAYDYFIEAVRMSERWRLPVLLRMTTRVCHSKSVVICGAADLPASAPHFVRDRAARVMIPAYARPAHLKLRAKLDAIQQWAETAPINTVLHGGTDLGIIANGVAALHAHEAVPEASLLKLGVTYPLPFGIIRAFAMRVKRCVVIEEGDPVLLEACRAEGIAVEGKAPMYRHGELSTGRVARIIAGDVSPEAAAPRGKAPQLCQGCPHRTVFEVLRDLDCIVAGDIGCYTLGVLPPFEAMDTCVCMGASIGVGLGLRHVLRDDEGRRVVSVIGDSTFFHSGITGIVDMVYNPPPSGHVVIVLDNGTTAMTGLQEHPGTGVKLSTGMTMKVSIEDVVRAIGVQQVRVLDLAKERDALTGVVKEMLASGKLCVLIVCRPCLLSAKKRAKA